MIKNHGSESIASGIRDSLAKVGVSSAEKVAAIGADGHNAVLEKLVQLLEKENGDTVPAVWDQVHLMSLGEGDARKHSCAAWVRRHGGHSDDYEQVLSRKWTGGTDQMW